MFGGTENPPIQAGFENIFCCWETQLQKFSFWRQPILACLLTFVLLLMCCRPRSVMYRKQSNSSTPTKKQKKKWNRCRTADVFSLCFWLLMILQNRRTRWKSCLYVMEYVQRAVWDWVCFHFCHIKIFQILSAVKLFDREREVNNGCK